MNKRYIAPVEGDPDVRGNEMTVESAGPRMESAGSHVEAGQFRDEADALRIEIEEVRARIVECLLQIDEITLQVNPQIEVDYAVKIGCYENELFRCQIEARRARRRFALAQARKNRGENLAKSDIAAIDVQLDRELRGWEARLQRQVDDYLARLDERAHSRALTPTEARELKKLHRDLVKRLHPDMRPSLAEEGERFFMITQAAFKNGDIETLRSVEVATAHLAREDVRPDGTLAELAAERELLSAQLRVTEDRLAQLKSMPPYSLREQLADVGWVCARVKELKHRIEEQKEAKAAYDEHFRQLTGEGGA